MFRKKDRNKNEPMPKKQLRRIVKAFKEQGGQIRMDDEAQKYLDLKGDDGLTINDKLVFLRKNPSRSVVFEELIHTAQFRNGEIKKFPIDAIKAEINAKAKLLKYAKQYGLTEKEINTTKQLLLRDEEELKRLEEQDGI